MIEQPASEPRLPLETWLYTLALVLALFLRLLHLGSQPLNEQEAGWALQALQAAHMGAAPQTGLNPQPGYTMLTGAIFALFGDTDLAARLWPALAGSALVLLPLLLRSKLGAKAAIVMAFGLALDPGLVVISRQAGGPMPALACSALALGFWYARKPVWVGILGALALLSGPAFWFGLLAWGLVQGGIALLRRRSSPVQIEPERDGEASSVDVYTERLPRPEIEGDEAILPPASVPSYSPFRTALLSGLVTFILVGSGFLLYPAGLASAIYALPTFLAGWATQGSVTAGQMLVTLLVYQPFGVIFAVVALARWAESRFLHQYPLRESQLIVIFWAYFLVALLLGLLYPSRELSYLVFALVPLWGAAAIALASYLPDRKPNAVAGLQTAIIFILAALLWLWLASSEVLAPANSPMIGMLRPAIVIGILALGALTTALVALGWQWESARDGLVWGLAAAFLVYSTAALWGAAYLNTNQPQELWGTEPAPGQERLLMDTLDQLSVWERGMTRNIDVVSLVDTPSMRWALRGYPQARFASSLPSDQLPAVVITRREAEPPALASSYRGQDFVWWVRPAWLGALPPNPILWLSYRQAPLINEYIILWARADLFPGSEAQTNP